MPSGRVPIDLEPFKDLLTYLYLHGGEEERKARCLVHLLKVEHDIKTSRSTLMRNFRNWGVRQPKALQLDSIHPNGSVLKNRLLILFWEEGLEDDEIWRVLRREGWNIGRYTVVRLRLELGLWRRLGRDMDHEEVDDAVRQLVQEEMKKGVIEGYGKGYLRTHFRQNRHIVSVDRLFRIYRELNPEAVARRKRDLQRRRGEYIVPGPNYIWSIDGYDKLKPYGIEIYGCIDAYSRRILWIYVGISNATQISCLKQFLEIVDDLQFQPSFVRSDRGGETVLLAQAHYRLIENREPDISFEQCYLYGPSTKNQRIEAWWSQFSKGLIFTYRNFFGTLSQQGLYDKTKLADQIAFLTIFMPLIRDVVRQFRRTWNSHSMRPQPGRVNNVSGKPNVLWNAPPEGVQDFRLYPDMEYVRKMKEEVEDWDMDAFLPEATLDFCMNHLATRGFDPIHRPPLEDIEERNNPYVDYYLDLRTAVEVHLQEGNTGPELGLLESPTGASEWRPTARENSGIHVDVHLEDI